MTTPSAPNHVGDLLLDAFSRVRSGVHGAVEGLDRAALTLRVDAHAQWEIQEYGRVMAGMLKRVAPLSYEAWIDYDVRGTHLSRGELEALRALVAVDGAGTATGESGTGLSAGGTRLDRAALETHGLARREIDELFAKLSPPPALPDFSLDVASARSPEHFADRFAHAVPATDGTPAD